MAGDSEGVSGLGKGKKINPRQVLREIETVLPKFGVIMVAGNQKSGDLNG
jgi:hypothetical protein